MTKRADKFTEVERLRHHVAQLTIVLGAERKDHERVCAALAETSKPVPLILTCPACGARHIDEGEFSIKVHHTHSCQACGMTWRPAVIATVGVQFLPGFKNPPSGAEGVSGSKTSSPGRE